METITRPFSFREFLRHRGEEPQTEPARWTSAERSLIENRFGEYLLAGGFPEAQGLATGLRVTLLQSYVDTVLFRDVVDRYGISQVAALRWLIRQCLRNPAGEFSVHRLHLDLEAQDHGVAKDAVHALFSYLLDSFLIDAVALATESERRRNSNPRKVYPIDTGMIGAFDASGRANLGRALETLVHTELARRGAEMGYVCTRQGFEVDFRAHIPGGERELIRVCADISDAGTLTRELRGLEYASLEEPGAIQRLLVLDRWMAAETNVPNPVMIQPVYEWLLTPPPTEGDGPALPPGG